MPLFYECFYNMLCVAGGFFFFLVQKQDILFWSLGGD